MSAITPLKLAWVIVYVPEIDRALTVYEEAFGLTRTFITPDETYGELDTGGTTLAFAHDDLGARNFPGGPRRPSLDEQPANVELAFTTEDVPAGVERALAAGCTLLAAPEKKPHGQTVAWIRDPWGTLIEVATPIG
ncbi:MAG: VOC family protein [Solirubrobacteraceae bacterium]|nr:VOC family protein [Solirubrobacteraceae bacterium]